MCCSVTRGFDSTAFISVLLLTRRIFKAPFLSQSLFLLRYRCLQMSFLCHDSCHISMVVLLGLVSVVKDPGK